MTVMDKFENIRVPPGYIPTEYRFESYAVKHALGGGHETIAETWALRIPVGKLAAVDIGCLASVKTSPVEIASENARWGRLDQIVAGTYRTRITVSAVEWVLPNDYEIWLGYNTADRDAHPHMARGGFQR